MAALTVRELIAELECIENKDMEIRFSYNYGDYWKTQVAATIDTVELGYVKYSEYHRMDKVVDVNEAHDENEFDEEGNPIDDIDLNEVLILS